MDVYMASVEIPENSMPPAPVFRVVVHPVWVYRHHYVGFCLQRRWCRLRGEVAPVSRNGSVW
jgi:hypothetical protein